MRMQLTLQRIFFNVRKFMFRVTYSHHFRSAKKWGLLAQQFQRTEYQRAIPVCPTVPLLDISLFLP